MRGMNPWMFAVRLALWTCLAASFVRVWTDWAVGSWEASGEPATFWGMIAAFVRETSRLTPGQLLIWFGDQFVGMVMVFNVGFWVGRLVAWRRGIGTDTTDRDG